MVFVVGWCGTEVTGAGRLRHMPEQGGVEQMDPKLRNGNEKGPSPLPHSVGGAPVREARRWRPAAGGVCGPWEELNPTEPYPQ